MADSFVKEKIKILGRNFFSSLKFIPDEAYLKFYYKLRVGHKLNLDNPKGYNEKLNWLKIYDRKPLYTTLADKLLVRDVVEKKIGKDHTIPLLGSWDNFEDINFDTLPDAFVLKCNHDSGSVKIIKDKNALSVTDKKKLQKHFAKCQKQNPWWMAREWPYKNIKPCIIAEKYMDGGELKDYKFLCFDGVPKVVFVVSDRFSEQKHEDYFDMDGNKLDIYNGVPASTVPPQLPECFDEMKEIAAKLSEGLPTVRMDLYEQNGTVYFGEYTFYSAGGTLLFEPKEWEMKMGEWTNIKAIKE